MAGRWRLNASMISQASFAKRLEALGPFEPCPELAVAVSGGSDSLALVLLADAWARQRGGRVTALTVDHGLRADSGREALQTGRWLKKRGIAHRILVWKGEKPQQGLMEAARAMRYRLLEDWCRKAGILHLLLAHQIEDQAETLLMRLARGSGPDGLSCMAPLMLTRHVRLLRPLLDVSREALKAYLEKIGQDWIDDPSNANPRFERARLRSQASHLTEAGLTTKALAASAAKLARQRRHLDDETDVVLARFVGVDPLGFAWLGRDFLTEAPDLLAGRALSRLLRFLAGGGYPPAEEGVSGLLAAMRLENWRGSTLAGCQLRPAKGRILAFREVRACEGGIRLKDGLEGLWDGRYLFKASNGRRLVLQALGAKQAASLAASAPELKALCPPFAVWASLPALYDARGVFAVPGLGYKRSRRGREALTRLDFAPGTALSGASLLLSSRSG